MLLPKTVVKICQFSVHFLCYSNTIQFTHTQIEAIRAGMQPGLTMVRIFYLFTYFKHFMLSLDSSYRYIQWNTWNAYFCSLSEGTYSISSLKYRKITNVQHPPIFTKSCFGNTFDLCITGSCVLVTEDFPQQSKFTFSVLELLILDCLDC